MKQTLYFLKNILFIAHVVGIVLYEYMLSGDFNVFVDNILHKLSRKNILYVKLFQACALNNTIIDNALNHKLIKFCDNAPWTSDDIDVNSLLQLEEKYNIHIPDKHQPINAGMISLVYKGSIIQGEHQGEHQGKTVIVKIKRRNIEEQLNAAIETVLFILMLADWLPFLNIYDFSAVVKKNIGIITQQVNFNTEVKNIQKFQSYCQRLNYIKIPQVYPEVTIQFPNVILMEYVDGKTLQNIDKTDRETYAKQLLKFVYLTTFLYGCYHGDLHVGNILFLKDTSDNACKICILDFGIVYEMENTKDVVFDIFSNIIDTPPEQIAEKMLHSGLIEPVEIIRSLNPTHYATLIQFLSQFINQSVHIEKKLNHHQIFIFLSELNTYINSIHVENINVGVGVGVGGFNIRKKGLRMRFSDDLVKMQVFFAMSHGVMLALCENINYIELSDQVMKETFHLDLFI